MNLLERLGELGGAHRLLGLQRVTGAVTEEAADGGARGPHALPRHAAPRASTHSPAWELSEPWPRGGFHGGFLTGTID